MPKHHLVTIEHCGEMTNLVVEISNERLMNAGGTDPATKERAQYEIAFKLACMFLRTGGDTKLFTQVYNREITRGNFSAEYGPEMVLADGSKGWIVKAPRAEN